MVEPVKRLLQVVQARDLNYNNGNGTWQQGIDKRSDCRGSVKLVARSKVEGQLLDNLDDEEDEDTVNINGENIN